MEEHTECEKRTVLPESRRVANRHPASRAKGLTCFLKLIESSEFGNMPFLSLPFLEEIWGKKVFPFAQFYSEFNG